METVSIPRSEIYTDDEHVVAEWHDDGKQLQAQFILIDVEDDDTVDHDEEALFHQLAELTETRTVDETGTLDDVATGVLWLVSELAAPPAPNAENEEDDSEGPTGVGREVA